MTMNDIIGLIISISSALFFVGVFIFLIIYVYVYYKEYKDNAKKN